MRLIKLSSGGDIDFVGTEEECRKELSDCICNSCFQDLVSPYEYDEDTQQAYHLEDGSTIIRETIWDLLGTSCGAEFMVEH